MAKAPAPLATVLIPKIDPATGLIDPSLLPSSTGGGGGAGGGGPQAVERFYPGPLVAQLGVAAFRMPPGGAVIVGVGIEADFSSAGRVILDVRLGGSAVYRFDTANTPSRYAPVTIPAGGGERLSIDVVAATGSADAQPQNVTVQVWWRYP